MHNATERQKREKKKVHKNRKPPIFIYPSIHESYEVTGSESHYIMKQQSDVVPNENQFADLKVQAPHHQQIINPIGQYKY